MPQTSSKESAEILLALHLQSLDTNYVELDGDGVKDEDPTGVDVVFDHQEEDNVSTSSSYNRMEMLATPLVEVQDEAQLPEDDSKSNVKMFARENPMANLQEQEQVQAQAQAHSGTERWERGAFGDVRVATQTHRDMKTPLLCPSSWLLSSEKSRMLYCTRESLQDTSGSLRSTRHCPTVSASYR